MTEPTCGNQPPFDPLRDKPLTVQLLNGTLSIEVGVNVLVKAFEQREDNWWEEDGKEGRYVVINPEEFAQGIVNALLEEEEDGSDHVARLLDRASWTAMENCCGVEQVEE